MFTIKNTSCVFRNLKQVHLAVHNTTGNGLIAVLGLGLPGLPKPSFVKVLGAPEPQDFSGSVGVQMNALTLRIEEKESAKWSRYWK